MQLTEPYGCGVPLVVYSAMLTRGVDDATGAYSDMDLGFGGACMIGRHNYATQVLPALQGFVCCCFALSRIGPLDMVFQSSFACSRPLPLCVCDFVAVFLFFVFFFALHPWLCLGRWLLFTLVAHGMPQEMVNLLLVGRAHSNVFDGVKVMEGSGKDPDLHLRGIPHQSAFVNAPVRLLLQHHVTFSPRC